MDILTLPSIVSKSIHAPCWGMAGTQYHCPLPHQRDTYPMCHLLLHAHLIHQVCTNGRSEQEREVLTRFSSC